MPQQGALANEIVTIGFCGAVAKAALRVDGSAASGTAATQSAMMKENKRLVIITFSPPITTPGNFRFLLLTCCGLAQTALRVLLRPTLRGQPQTGLASTRGGPFFALPMSFHTRLF